MTRMMRMFLPLPLLMAAVIGCAQSKKPSVIKGTITYNGAPVKGGTIAFYRIGDKQEGSIPVNIEKEGTYTASGVPLGEVTVTVDTESFNPDRTRSPDVYQGKGKNADKNKRGRNDYRNKMAERGNAAAAQSEGDADRYVKIPAKYSKKETTTLKTTVKGGTNTYDIALTD